MDCEFLGKSCHILAQGVVTGVLIGGVYALIALGIVIINKASGVFNFAHGVMMLVGALIFWSLFQNVPLTPLLAFAFSGVILTMLTNGVQWPVTWSRRRIVIITGAVWFITGILLTQSDNLLVRAIIGTTLGTALVGLLIERLTIRPLIGQPLFTMIMMTIAVSEVLRGVANLLWGTQDRILQVFATPNPLGFPQSPQPIRIEETQSWLGGAIIIKVEFLIAFVVALVAFFLFWLFFNYTSIGLSMRATAENQDLAQAVGLRIRTILAIAWAIAGVLAGVAGVLLAGSTSLSSATLPFVALRVFPAVLLGGLESIGGAVIGGLVIGLAEQMGTRLFDSAVGEQMVPFLVLMIVLIIRPEGLFGQKRIERI